MRIAETSRLLTAAEMAEVDRRTIAGGTSGRTLMENAGRSAAEIIRQRFSLCPAVVLCGPGNNGGDGLVIAYHLKKAGWPVSVATEKGNLNFYKGDVASMAKRYKGDVVPLAPSALEGKELVIDALFGTGLCRPLETRFGQTLHALIASRLPVVAIDIPSGISSDSGQVLGIAAPAVLTITFACRKRGHALIPGRAFCGETIAVDIGIPEKIIASVAGECFENHPSLWRERMPWPRIEQHKYDRGHALIMGGPAWRTGAAKLAAHAALRMAAGLVTIACPSDALAVYAPALAAVMLHPFENAKDIPSYCKERKISAVLIGPGYGVGNATRKIVLALLEHEITLVLDADALTSFEGHAPMLFNAIRNCKAPVALTPHAGEFRRLFGSPSSSDTDKVSIACEAAKQSGAVMILKGADTVIAHPKGKAFITTNAPPILATAGSGDVLAGMIAGLLAADMPVLEAAAAAAWVHGECANRFGVGFIADDFDAIIPEVLHHIACGK